MKTGPSGRKRRVSKNCIQAIDNGLIWSWFSAVCLTPVQWFAQCSSVLRSLAVGHASVSRLVDSIRRRAFAAVVALKAVANACKADSAKLL